VALDTVKQLEAQLMMRNYEGFLKWRARPGAGRAGAEPHPPRPAREREGNSRGAPPGGLPAPVLRDGGHPACRRQGRDRGRQAGQGVHGPRRARAGRPHLQG